MADIVREAFFHIARHYFYGGKTKLHEQKSNNTAAIATFRVCTKKCVWGYFVG